jgi:cysteine desulfurase
MPEVYLDWAATAPADPFAVQILQETALRYYGNPSSPHEPGSQAEKILEQARSILAQNLECLPQELYFTSGATEANNMMVFSLLKQALTLKKDFPSYSVVLSGIEHASLWQPVLTLQKWGFKVKVVNPNSRGIIDPDALDSALDKGTVMVAVMLVNNESGALQPVGELTKRVRSFSQKNGRKIIFHSDIVQAVGKIPLSLTKLGIDSASLSAHKLGALKGTGALFLSNDLRWEFLYQGGDQEKGSRPGTQNVAASYSFARLVEKQNRELEKNLRHAEQMMDLLLQGINQIPQAVIIPEGRADREGKDFSPYILTLAFPPLPGEVVVRMLNDHHIFISTGSACHSRKQERTRVMESMGLSRERALQVVRLSMGPTTSPDDIAYFIAVIKRELSKLG